MLVLILFPELYIIQHCILKICLYCYLYVSALLLIGPKDTTLGLLTFACCFSASSFLPESRTRPWLRHADRFWVPCCYIPSLSSKNLLQQLHHTLLVFNNLEAALKKKKKKESKTLTRRSLLRSCQVLSLCICVSICTKMLYSEGDGQWEAAAWVLPPLPPPMRSFWSRQGCWSLSEVEDSRWRGTSWALRRAQSFWQTLLAFEKYLTSWLANTHTHFSLDLNGVTLCSLNFIVIF